MKTRQAVKNLVCSWQGKKESDGSHKSIIDIYNSFAGILPRNTKMQYSWPWCACTWSALAIQLDYTDIMPIEISCYYLIEAAKKMGIWIEQDKRVPKVGEAVLYHWNDGASYATTDCMGTPDHVGTVIEVYPDAGYFVVMEGNYSDQVKKRTVSINGRYIRGFISPEYNDSVPVISAEIQMPGKDLQTIVHEVIAGVWGDGEKRVAALKAAGYDPEEVRLEVNRILNGGAVVAAPNQDPDQVYTKEVYTTCYAECFNGAVAGTYKTTADLYMRNDAGSNKKALCIIPNNTQVRCYGYYTNFNGVKWYLSEVALNGVKYTGFSCSSYLQKA